MGCPASGGGPLDPAAVPLQVAILLPASLLLYGLSKLWFASSSLTDGHQQIGHGVVMWLFAYPLGLGIPHVKIKKAMALTHAASLLQGTILVVCGYLWHDTFGFVDGSTTSTMAKQVNLYGMWGNTVGCLWSAVMGASDLLYVTKGSVTYVAPQWVENVLHIVLKSQGLCNVISVVMILNQFIRTNAT